MKCRSGRTPFRMQQPNQFDLSNHQATVICNQTRKLAPTIIRLARLMTVADPSQKYKLPISDQEELEVQITAFRDLVNERHFPIFRYHEDDEHLGEVMDMWASGWSNRTYHPFLNKIPVRPLGFADHDVDQDDYGKLVALLYWLNTPSYMALPNLDLDLGPQFSTQEQEEFNLTAVETILSAMELEPPLSYLPGLIATVTKQTDTGMPARLTFFLDACPLCGNFSGPQFDWTVENFTWFRDDWKIAKPIHLGNQELIRWSFRGPERLAEISTVLRHASVARKGAADSSILSR